MIDRRMTHTNTITYIIFLIFFGTAILSTMALYTRQSLLVAYIVLGAVLGPWGLKLLSNGTVIKQTGDIGIIFLLFLLGLHLQPQNLLHSMRKMSLITLISSVLFFVIGFVPCFLFGYTLTESVIIGIAAMFSSTIIGIKLLPTTILHHQHTGELVISILLLQDVIAIATLLIMQIVSDRASSLSVEFVVSAFPVLIGTAYLFERYVLSVLLRRFDKIHEYIFILSIGWCLCMAELSHYFGLSEEIGAFIAGVSLATNPISFYIAESLKPLRDFFLVIFFFSIGAGFNFNHFNSVIVPACVLAGGILILKPIIFRWLLERSGEVKSVSKEIGIRLGQMSEFSLLVIFSAEETNLLSGQATNMAEFAIIITFIVSCYWTVIRYPTPHASSEKLRRD
jgi:Kef-type K+ transport system membrane component KefB